MTNNLEDFEQPDLESGGGLSPPGSGMRANLAQAWRTRPLFKLLVLMAVVGAIIAVSISLFSKGTPPEVTKLMKPPGLHEAPGGPASPYFVKETEEASAARAQEAMKTGGSALPTPIGHDNSIEEMTTEKQKKDPLIELRKEIEQQKQQIVQMQVQRQQPPPVQPAKPEQFDESLGQAMQKQMQQLMAGWEPRGIKQVKGAGEDEGNNNKSALSGTGTGTSNPASTPAAAPTPTKILVPAGTVSYAQLLTEANSDVPGPILAQILSGPLSGARAVGKFEVMNDYLVLRFKLADLRKADYQIDALALDPDTTLGGMATEVDERYFTRVLLPAAAGFMQGLGQALSQGNQTVTTNGETTIITQSSKGLQQGMFQGAAQAGQTMSQFFQNQANQTKPLVRVAAGTPMGLFFVSSVVTGLNGEPYNNPYEGPPGTMAGYPGGYGYTGYGATNPQGLGYNGSLPGGYYPGMPMSGYNGQSPLANTTSNASAAPYPSAAVPYNTSLIPNPNTTMMPNTYGIGTPGFSP